jgi:hypothetical protein
MCSLTWLPIICPWAVRPAAWGGARAEVQGRARVVGHRPREAEVRHLPGA